MNPLTSFEVEDDLYLSNDTNEGYLYECDHPDGDSILIRHYAENGEVIGTQTLTFNIGEYEPVIA